jgi:hypothetical protein
MFFQEYAITPEVFSKEYSEKDPLIGKDILYFLKQLRQNGLIANINKNEWIKKVLHYREELSPAFRDKLSKVFEYLQDHQRIVEHETILQEHMDLEMDWLKVAIREDELKPYLAILFTGSFEKPHAKAVTIEEFVEDEKFDNLSTGFEFAHSTQNIKKHLTDFLIYAKKLTIIDPYFTYNNRDEESLLLYAELFGKRRGNRLKNRHLIVHTFYNKRDKFIDPDSNSYKDRWIKVCKDIYEKYHHKTTINLWDDRRMHDRFMITNQGGISSGRGFGLRDDMSSFWSLIDTQTQRRQLNYFNTNANPDIKLALSITYESEYSQDYKAPLTGKIKKIVHNNERGKVGFVEIENGQDYYFQLPLHVSFIEKIVVGADVEFELKENYRGESAFIKKVL